MRINPTRLIGDFTELVLIDSPSFSERQIGDYIKSKLSALGLRVFEDGAGQMLGGNCGNIFGFLDGTINAASLLFSAHMDTVEPSRGKTAVIDRDGTIRSRGDTVLGADDFSGIAAILEALTIIREYNLPHRPLEVLFTVAEEIYCQGISRFNFQNLKAKDAFVLDLTGPVGTAAYKAPAIITFTVEVIGISSHAGFEPERGVNAIAAASEAIKALPLGRLDHETTLNIGIIKGGLATNIVPDKCIVKGETRSYSGEKALNCIELVEREFQKAAQRFGASYSFTNKIVCSAYETPLHHPILGLFKKACADIQLGCNLVKTFGGSDNNTLFENGITGLVLASAMEKVHSCQEYTTTDELCRIAELTLQLMTIDPNDL